jgi:hypothetical protein
MLFGCWKHSNFDYNVSIGAVGGIKIFWNPATLIFDNFFFTKWSLTTHYRAVGSNKDGVITNAYGP